jgi:hypothetical protein
VAQWIEQRFLNRARPPGAARRSGWEIVPLPTMSTVASTSGSTGLSPLTALTRSLLQHRSVTVAASFSYSPHAATIPHGLLIPRSQVRSLSGPLRFS